MQLVGMELAVPVGMANPTLTMTAEQLAEMLAVSRECGRAANDVARFQREADSNSARSWAGKNAREFLKQARKDLDNHQAALDRCRTRVCPTCNGMAKVCSERGVWDRCPTCRSAS